ncbi:unnamed protein product [Clonostachys rosea]|uniref:VWFA domain-containing protein n=1 Tax=Bionectria ochroleuca TaxID=29856 RepID=A0ABY6UQZ9_BIOOC|nr:unnamed protein product [Clonostachys rosea]
MAYSERDIVSHMVNFAETSKLDRILFDRTIREAGVIGAAALDQWSTAMGKALPEISVDWKQFSLSIVKLALYDIHLLVDQGPAMRSPIRARHVQQQIEATVDLILPFSLKNKIQIYSCDYQSPKGIPINSVQDVTDAFGTSEFASFGTQTQLVGLALKEKLLPLVPNKADDFERPSLIYIFTTGTSGDLVQAVNEYKAVMKQRGLDPAAIAFEIIQIGRNYPARQELGKLDAAYGVGEFLDVCSETTLEDRYRQDKGWTATSPAMLAMRNLVGALESWFVETRTRSDDLDGYLAKKRTDDLEREVGVLKKALAKSSKNPEADKLRSQIEQMQQALNSSQKEANQLRQTVSTFDQQKRTLETEKSELYRRLTTTHRYLMQWKSNANNATDIANGVGPLGRQHLFYGGITVNGQFKNSHGYGNYDHLIPGRQRVEEPLVP